MVEYILTQADSADTKELLAEYYALRAKVFSNEYGQGYYPSGADEFDLRPNTLFLLGIEGGKVVSGLRFIVHEAGTDTKLHFESPFPQLEAQNLLPHLDTGNLQYAELGSVSADPAPHLKALHLGTAIQKKALELVNKGEIKADVVIARVGPNNATILLRAAEEAGIARTVREDTCVTIKGKKCLMMMFSRQPDFPFLSEEMKAAEIGTPPDVFIAKARAERTKAAEVRENDV